MSTIQDIARELGVSSSTVSRALNDSRLISSDLRKQVKAAAKKMGYHKRPNRRQRGRAILNVKLVLPRHADPERSLFYDFASLIEGMRRGFTLCGLNLLCEVNAPKFEPYPHKKGGDIDAFVFAFHRPSASVIKQLSENSTPYVVLNRAINNVSSVAVDHDAGMLELVDHLISGTPDLRARFVSIEGLSVIHDERLSGLAKAMKQRGIPFDVKKDVMCFPDISSIQTEGIAGVAKGANALICVNDIVGTVVLAELDRLGLKVPDQIAVTGFDDSPVRRLSRPLLTTVSLPVEELAYQAATRLQGEIIENKSAVDVLRLKGKLVPGESTR